MSSGVTSVGLIWAQARGGVIGVDGRLPWHLPEDLRLFRATTMGATVVMGRRTWESLPERFRTLPGRTNVVLTTRPGWAADGAEVASSVEEVLANHRDLWVIGGASVYAAFLPVADRVVLTELDEDVAGDTWAPALGPEWRPVTRDPEQGWAVSTSGLRYAVTDLRRAEQGGPPPRHVAATTS